LVALELGEVLYLDQQDVIAAGGLDMSAAVRHMEVAQSLFDQGECINPDKSVLRWSEDPNVENERGRVNFLSAYVGGAVDSLGMKWVGSFPHNRVTGNLPRATALIVLNDPDTGVPIALMEGSIISAVRTAAVAGVAVKHLARPDSRVIGLIGAGVQCRTHLMVLNEVLEDIEEVRVFNRTRANAQKLKTEMEERLGLNIRIVDTPEDAIRGTDIPITATTVHDPIMRGEWLGPGMLSIQFAGHECTYDVVTGADKLVCDDWEGLKHRGIMTPARMYQEGLLRDEDVHGNIGAVAGGRIPGRESDDEHIHFASVGMGVSDVAIAAMIYQRAIADGIGNRLRLWDKPLWV
jgi:N-[(2S)-2-amino-2-carboxyethyl]-L-glutamate dehydrogenase